jgi:hypothetical protein
VSGPLETQVGTTGNVVHSESKFLAQFLPLGLVAASATISPDQLTYFGPAKDFVEPARGLIVTPHENLADDRVPMI